MQENINACVRLLNGCRSCPEFTNIRTYYFDDPARRRNGKFDVALEFNDQHQIFEAKYYINPMSLSDIHTELNQIKEIRMLNIFRPGFIAIHGFEQQERGYTYYTREDPYR